ncbi:MAG TPA: response regulator [Acidobacteriaceae bacterium]|nr:response regulator [Acidobacteriaceae bacterium]
MTTETKPFEILLAEDSEGDAELVRQALQQHHIDCSLHIVADGARAIEFINRIETDPNARPLDLLLLDLRLPICDGDEVLTRLRSTKRYPHTPVIVMTGLSSSAVTERISRHRAIVYFEKPSTLDEFLQLGSMIRQVFEQRTVNSGHQIAEGGAV